MLFAQTPAAETKDPLERNTRPKARFFNFWRHVTAKEYSKGNASLSGPAVGAAGMTRTKEGPGLARASWRICWTTLRLTLPR